MQLMAATDRAKGSHGGISCFLVDMDAPGVKLGTRYKTMMGDAPWEIVLENVRVALQRKLGTSFHFWQSERSLDRLNPRALELLAAVDLESYAHDITAELSYGRKRALEIATTLALDPELMLLDEPTQGMGHEDVGRVVELIRKVSAGRTIMMVEHNLNVVADLSHTITVLARGAVLAEGPYAEVAKNPQVLEAYVGSAHA